MKSVLQTDEWGDFKAKYGWTPLRLGDVLVLSRPILLGQTMLYAPETNIDSQALIQSLLRQVLPQAREKNAFVFRLEIAIPDSEDLARILREQGFRKSFESVQPEWRAVVDIRSDEEQILSAMHQKGRYNIRVAQRHGVTVSESKDINDFYQLYLATAKRDGFSARDKEYFQDFLKMVPGAILLIARAQNEILAAGIFVFFEETASYLYGASSSTNREMMAPYLLHWTVIQEAKKRHCLVYDLGEIPPDDSEDHPLKGLREFKMKFGAQAVHYLGSWDYVYNPFWYSAFRIGEKLRRGFRA